jgi:RNA polymerase sigma factor (TIGR02999 family)
LTRSPEGSGEADEPRSPGEITRLLHAWRAGSDAAQQELWQCLYGELRELAQGVLFRHPRPGPVRRTSLVHKAYLRLLGSDVEWRDRQHFFAVAARVMRFVLADEARRQLTAKRGDGQLVPLDDARTDTLAADSRRPEEVLAIHQALERLGSQHPRREKLVELRYFAGLSVEETAEILEVTPRTVVRDWRAARTWLHGELHAR